MGQLRKRLLSIPVKETTFPRRGFHTGDLTARWRLEKVGAVFLQGYHASIEDDAPESLVARLDSVEREWHGFAYEGAAMGLTLLDQLTPWKRDRLQAFINGPGERHIYMVHVGVGWVLARLRRRVQRPLARLDPLLGWLAVDGYGFHEGYFHWRRYLNRRPVPSRLTGYARRVFDQGLGRSLWFVDGADVERIPATIAGFPLSRRADLWSGVGLACAYAGGVDRARLDTLRAAASAYVPQLAQGVCFAAQARRRAENPAEHTEIACRIICGLSADEAAQLTHVALDNLSATQDEPVYEVWRRRIQALCIRESVLA